MIRRLFTIILISSFVSSANAAPFCLPVGSRVTVDGKDGRFYKDDELLLMIDCDLRIQKFAETISLQSKKIDNLNLQLSQYDKREELFQEELSRRTLKLGTCQSELADCQSKCTGNSFWVYLGVGLGSALLGGLAASVIILTTNR